jgi:hypothetical protein
MSKLWFVLDPDDRGPAWGPVQDENLAYQRAEATGGRLFSVPATADSPPEMRYLVPCPSCYTRSDAHESWCTIKPPGQV